jgi:hypothetical protein
MICSEILLPFWYVWPGGLGQSPDKEGNNKLNNKILEEITIN